MEVFVFDWWWTSHQSPAHKGLRILRFCIVSWKDEREPSIKYCMGRQIDVSQKFTRTQSFGQNWWRANGIRVEHLPRIHHIAAQPQCPGVTVKMERNTREISGRIIFMSMLNDISWGSKDNKKRMRVKGQSRFSLCEEIRSRTMVILRAWIREKVVPISEDSPQGEWDKIAEQMMLTFAESTHPVFRATSPLSRGVLFFCKGGGKLSMHYCADFATIETVFRTIISVNQLSLYGAVAEMCEEYESCHDWTGGPVVRGESSPSFVPNVINTNMPLNDDPELKKFLLQR